MTVPSEDPTDREPTDEEGTGRAPADSAAQGRDRSAGDGGCGSAPEPSFEDEYEPL